MLPIQATSGNSWNTWSLPAVYLQRGGSPTAHDRILASRLGAAAIDAIMEGQRNVMIGIEHDEVVYVPFTKAIKNDKPIKKDLVNVLRELSI